jgi:hypothetical protein
LKKLLSVKVKFILSTPIKDKKAPCPNTRLAIIHIEIISYLFGTTLKYYDEAGALI